MPIPVLNTSGIDVANSIKSIEAMKLSEASRKSLDEEIAGAKQTRTSNALINAENLDKARMENKKLKNETSDAAFKRENSIANLKEKSERLSVQAQVYKHFQKGLHNTVAIVEAGNPVAYQAFRNEAIEKGRVPPESLPKPVVFYDTKVDLKAPGGTIKVFNKERFSKWANRTLMTAEQMFAAGEKAKKDYVRIKAYGPNEQVVDVPVKIGDRYNPADDLGPGWSLTDPNDVKTKLVEGEDGIVTRERVSDSIGKKAYIKKTAAGDKLVKVIGEDGKPKWVKSENAVGKEAYVKPDKGSKTELTPAQKVAKERADKKTMRSIQNAFLKTDRDGNLPELAISEQEGKPQADEYNRLAEEAGSSSRLVWDPDAYTEDQGVISKFFGNDPPESIGGWVMEGDGKSIKSKAKAETKSASIENPTEDEVKAMKSGTKFTVDGKTYVRE